MSNYKRVLGIDYGTKRAGLAISDPMQMIAGPLQKIEKSKGEEMDPKLLKLIIEINEEYDLEEIIIGFPKNMDGSIGPMAKRVNAFKSILENKLSTPIFLWDERLTSMQAEKEMIRAGLSRKKRKNKIDVMASQLMLQSYLDQKKNNL